VGADSKDSFVKLDDNVKDDLFGNTVANCPTAIVSMNNVEVPCILDTGLQFTTVTESFFKTTFCWRGP